MDNDVIIAKLGVLSVCFLVINQTASITGYQASYTIDNCTDCNSWNFALNGMIADQRPFVTGRADKAWAFFILPETILITKVRVFTNEVKHEKLFLARKVFLR